jgi:thiol:disulfide interchange protein
MSIPDFLKKCFHPMAVAALACLVASQAPQLARGQARPAAPVMVPKHIYSETAKPKADIAAALAQASREHKRVILDFGGDWCGDCKVLDANFHKPENAALLDSGFVLVHINVGHVDQNLDIAERYGIPLKKGVPALAVLDEKGKVLFAQQHGEFEDMRHMDAQSVNDFLKKWQP